MIEKLNTRSIRQQQIRLKEEIRQRIGDLANDADGAQALVELGFECLAAQHRPTRLTAKDRQSIRDNYRPATAESIAARSVTDEGLIWIFAMLIAHGRIYLDHSPASHWKAEAARDTDGAVAMAFAPSVIAAVKFVRDAAEKSGMSPFGAIATLILYAVHQAHESGMAWAKLARILIDGLDLAVTSGSPPRGEPTDRELTTLLMQQMGISRTQARKYVAEAKHQITQERIG